MSDELTRRFETSEMKHSAKLGPISAADAMRRRDEEFGEKVLKAAEGTILPTRTARKLITMEAEAIIARKHPELVPGTFSAIVGSAKRRLYYVRRNELAQQLLKQIRELHRNQKEKERGLVAISADYEAKFAEGAVSVKKTPAEKKEEWVLSTLEAVENQFLDEAAKNPADVVALSPEEQNKANAELIMRKELVAAGVSGRELNALFQENARASGIFSSRLEKTIAKYPKLRGREAIVNAAAALKGGFLASNRNPHYRSTFLLQGKPNMSRQGQASYLQQAPVEGMEVDVTIPDPKTGNPRTLKLYGESRSADGVEITCDAEDPGKGPSQRVSLFPPQDGSQEDVHVVIRENGKAVQYTAASVYIHA